MLKQIEGSQAVAEAVAQLADEGPDHAEGQHRPGDHPGHGGFAGAELLGDALHGLRRGHDQRVRSRVARHFQE